MDALVAARTRPMTFLMHVSHFNLFFSLFFLQEFNVAREQHAVQPSTTNESGKDFNRTHVFDGAWGDLLHMCFVPVTLVDFHVSQTQNY